MHDLELGIPWYLVFVVSTTIHEAAHAYAALRLGDPTAYHGGQVTLNPTPHIRREPMGMVVVPTVSFLLGGWMFGWASAPYDRAWSQAHPRRAAWMALAGPVSNLLLVLLAAGLIHLGMMAGLFQSPDSITFSQVTEAREPGTWAGGLAAVVSILFTLNLILLLFNLLPLPPLDGSALLMLVLSRDTSRRYMETIHQPAFLIVGLIVAWNLFGYVFGPIHLVAINLLYPGVTYR